MAPQLFFTVAGLILTVITLGSVAVSSYQSTDAVKAKLIAAEVGNIATASKLWLLNDSADMTYSALSPVAVKPYLPNLTLNLYSTALKSKAVEGVEFEVMSGATIKHSYVIARYLTATVKPIILEALANKGCQVINQSATEVAYQCTV